MDDDDNYEVLIKLVILGDIAVGKTNFLCRFVDNEFNIVHVSTVGFDFKSRICDITKVNKKVKFQIWDTAGQEKYMSINKNLFQRVQGVILMYDITKRETFERLDLWLNLIKQMTNDIPIVLVGNKLDQEDNIENGRIVEYSEGEDFARDNDFEFFEASAMDGTNIDKVFSSIGEKIIKNLQDDRMPSMVKVVADNKNVKKKKKCC